jgi:hypothetical protein
MIDQLGFNYGEKRFSYGIIPAITLARHALNKFMFRQLFAEISARILNAAIRMEDKTLARTLALDRLFECCAVLGCLYNKSLFE